jgi:hypothetical protein
MSEILNIPGPAAMYILSFVVIVLGGISLFVQRIYKLDKEGDKTVIELPFLGKLSTNYPALGFVFVGAAMAIFAFSRTGTDRWFVTGQFKAPPSKKVEWTKGTLTVEPRSFDVGIDGNGGFQISGNVTSGQKFEDVVGQITYTDEHFTGKILTMEAYDDYKNSLPTTVIHDMSNTGRNYKPVEVQEVDKP